MRALLLAAFAFLTACTPEITCDEVGCAQGLACDRQSGECVTVSKDCRVVDICTANEICDSNGQCRSADVLCADGNPCPSGLICDAQTGVCKPVFQCTVDGCGPAEVCDSRSEKCTAKSCAADSECPDTHVCETNLCRFGCRPNANSCPTGQSCLFQTGETAGLCQPNCVTDVDCPFGQRCVLIDGDPSCRLEPACQTNQDCRADETCISQTCLQPPCATDSDCLSTQVCELPTGTCLNVDCREDIYGSPANHSRETAFSLPPASACPNIAAPTCVYNDLTLCPGSSDWFSIHATGTDVVRIRVEQASLVPDIDIFVWATDGELLASNGLLNPVSTVRVAPNREQDIFVEIRPNSYEQSAYGLTIAREFCANDGFEENDSPEEATIISSAISTLIEIRAQTCGLDEDWFTIPALSQSSGLEIERIVSDTSLVFQVLTPDGEVYEVPRGGVQTWLRVGADGDYYVRALSALGLSTDYRFAYSITDGWACPDAGDSATPETAISGAPGPATYGLCPVGNEWDAVYLELPVTQDGVIDVNVVPGVDAPKLDVTLLRDEAGTVSVIRTAKWAGAAQHIVADVTPGRYLLRVTSSTAVSRIATPPDFEMSWAMQP